MATVKSISDVARRRLEEQFVSRTVLFAPAYRRTAAKPYIVNLPVVAAVRCVSVGNRHVWRITGTGWLDRMSFTAVFMRLCRLAKQTGILPFENASSHMKLPHSMVDRWNLRLLGKHAVCGQCSMLEHPLHRGRGDRFVCSRRSGRYCFGAGAGTCAITMLTFALVAPLAWYCAPRYNESFAGEL